MQSLHRDDILYSSIWEGMARQAWHCHFSLKTTRFPSFAYSGCMARVPFDWETPQEPCPGPFPTTSVQWVCNSTEVKCPLSLFSFKEQWGMSLFFLWLWKPTCVSHHTLQLDTNREPSITLPDSLCLLKGLLKELLKVPQKPQIPPARTRSPRLHHLHRTWTPVTAHIYYQCRKHVQDGLQRSGKVETKRQSTGYCSDYRAP